MTAGEHIVGRADDASVRVDLVSVSRRHARLVVEASTTIKDLGSKNGTWVGMTRVEGLCAWRTATRSASGTRG